MNQRLTSQERAGWMSNVRDWPLDAGGNALTRGVQFPNFVDAFAFMTKVAMITERADHHPEWSNVYGVSTSA